MTSPSWNPEWIWGVAIFALGVAIAYALIRNRQRTRGEKIATENATKALYREEDERAKSTPMPD